MKQAPTVLFFVSGRTFSERRRRIFEVYDARIMQGQNTAGMEDKQIDELRVKRAQDFFKKLVDQYCTGTGDFAEVKIPGGSLFKGYLARPNVLARLDPGRALLQVPVQCRQPAPVVDHDVVGVVEAPASADRRVGVLVDHFADAAVGLGDHGLRPGVVVFQPSACALGRPAVAADDEVPRVRRPGLAAVVIRRVGQDVPLAPDGQRQRPPRLSLVGVPEPLVQHGLVARRAEVADPPQLGSQFMLGQFLQGHRLVS